jgi:vacuolar protein-sorting-associated protein 4
MFRIHIGDTPHNLVRKDYEELAVRTDGYSGSDISIFVRNALMEPVRTCQIATHFKFVSGISPSTEESADDLLTPCSPADPDAMEMTLTDVPGDKLLPPNITKRDFMKAFATARPSVSKDDLYQYEKFTQEFGQEI